MAESRRFRLRLDIRTTLELVALLAIGLTALRWWLESPPRLNLCRLV